MYKTIYPSKDATIYQTTSSLNTGVDEILTIGKIVSESGAAGVKKTRAILQFDTTAVSASLSQRSIHTASASGSLRWHLKMYVSEERDVPTDYKISAHAIRESWVMGLGRYTNIPQSKEGVSWKYRDGEVAATEWTDEGGYFYSESYSPATASFSHVQGDIVMDVTGMVENWHNGSVTNNGLLIKRSGSQETDSTEYGAIDYYSKETNTIYSPRLYAVYDDTPTRVTSSMTNLTADDNISITGILTPQYKQHSEARIEIIAEPKYPGRSQTDAVSTTTTYALPTSSTYAIIDNTTDEIVIPYNTTGSVIACNNKHYIDVDMSTLYPERYYKLQIKVPDLIFTNSIQYFNIPGLFKVTR